MESRPAKETVPLSLGKADVIHRHPDHNVPNGRVSHTQFATVFTNTGQDEYPFFILGECPKRSNQQ